MSMMLKQRMEAMKKIIEADTDLYAYAMPWCNICFHTKNYVVKFGPRRDTMNEIIEADTDPKKEVLRLRLTFHAASFDHFSTSDRSKL